MLNKSFKSKSAGAIQPKKKKKKESLDSCMEIILECYFDLQVWWELFCPVCPDPSLTV